MAEKEEWVVLPHHVEQWLHVLRLIPPGVKVEGDQWLCWLFNYSFNTIKNNTLPLAHFSGMQYFPVLK